MHQTGQISLYLAIGPGDAVKDFFIRRSVLSPTGHSVPEHRNSADLVQQVSITDDFCFQRGADGTVMVYFYIDDMVNPVYSGLSTIAAQGIRLLEIDSGGSTCTKACYDDISLALVRPPNLVGTPSGRNMILTWPGEGFTLQKAESMDGPWSDVTTTSGFSYDTTSGVNQFFRLRN